MIPDLLMTIAAAALLGAATLGGDPATDGEAFSDRMSSAEIGALITPEAANLPPNCEAFYFPDPVTGELICNAVVCTSAGGSLSIHECSEFGL